jgi:hypothetical protein
MKPQTKKIIMAICDPLFNVSLVRSLSGFLYTVMYGLVLFMILAGFKGNLFKGYFEICVIAALVVLVLERWDIRFSNTEGIFLVSCVLTTLGYVYAYLGNYSTHFGSWAWTLAIYSFVFVLIYKFLIRPKLE